MDDPWRIKQEAMDPAARLLPGLSRRLQIVLPVHAIRINVLLVVLAAPDVKTPGYALLSA